MTLTAAESRKDVWAAIFRRRGGDGTYTRLFDNLDPLQRATLLSMFKVHKSELPVIGSVQDSGNWFILTTERLIWSVGDEHQDVSIDAVYHAKADFKQCCHSGDKLKMQQIQVEIMSGGEYPIKLEPGAPLFGVWNVLTHLGVRNRGKIHKPV